MRDYIDRQAAIDAVMILPQKWDGMFIQDLNCRLRDALNALPSAQPEIIRCKDCKTIIALKAALEPVKHGRWETVINGRGGFECSICHSYAPSYQDGVEWLSLYCPNCGAKMEPISASPENGQEVEE